MQDNWQWCNKCSGLAFFGNGALGACPAGGTHNHDNSGNYGLDSAEETADGQDGWRWCARCQGIYFTGNGSHGSCPAGGAHIDAGSGNYRLRSDGSGQSNWRWCVHCQGLWYAGDNIVGADTPWTGRCPAPGRDGHVADGSGDYVLDLLNAPAGPPPVGPVSVIGLPNRPPTFLLFGEKWLRISWPPYAGPRDGAALELYESTGPGSERFITELPIATTSNAQNMFGDICYRLRHCFSVRVRNRYGWSAPSQGCGTTLNPTPPVGSDSLNVDVNPAGDPTTGTPGLPAGYQIDWPASTLHIASSGGGTPIDTPLTPDCIGPNGSWGLTIVTPGEPVGSPAACWRTLPLGELEITVTIEITDPTGHRVSPGPGTHSAAVSWLGGSHGIAFNVTLAGISIREG